MTGQVIERKTFLMKRFVPAPDTDSSGHFDIVFATNLARSILTERQREII